MVTNNISAVPTDDPVQDDINALNSDMEQSVEIQQQTATLYDMLQALIKESYTAGNPDLICMEMNAAMGDYQGSTAAEWGAQNQVQNGLNNLNTDSQTMMNNITQALEGSGTTPGGGGSGGSSAQIIAAMQAIKQDIAAQNFTDITQVQIPKLTAAVNSDSSLGAYQRTQIGNEISTMQQNANLANIGIFTAALNNIYNLLPTLFTPEQQQLMAIQSDLAEMQNNGATQALMQRLNSDINQNNINPSLQATLQTDFGTLSQEFNSGGDMSGTLSAMYTSVTTAPAYIQVQVFEGDLLSLNNDLNTSNWNQLSQDAQTLYSDIGSGGQFAGLNPSMVSALQADCQKIQAGVAIGNNAEAAAAVADIAAILMGNTGASSSPTPPPFTPPAAPDAQQVTWINDMLNALNASSTFIQNNPSLFTDGTGNSIIATNESILTLFGSSNPTTIWNTISGWLQSSATQGTTSTEIQDYSSDIQSNGRTLGAQSSSSQTQMDLIVNQYKQTEGDLENFVQATLQSTLTQVHNEKNQ